MCWCDVHLSKYSIGKVSIEKHNDCSLIVPADVLYSDVETFEGGKLKYYYEHWKNYNSNTFIPDIVKNELKLNFNERPSQRCHNNFPFFKKRNEYYQLWDSTTQE